MSEVIVKKIIKGPAERIWETIRDFDGIDKYLPAVASCTVEGSGVGATRTCVMQDGLELHERLESLDEKRRTLTYVITKSNRPMPFEDYIGEIAVRYVGASETQVEWSSTFKAKGAPEAEIAKMHESLYSQAIEGLEKLHSQDMK